MSMTGEPVFYVFVLLAVVAVVSVIIFFDRLLDFRRAQVDFQDFLKGVINVLDFDNDTEALAICEESSTPLSNIVSTAIRHRNSSARVLREAVDSQGRAEIGRLERRIASLSIIAQIAPLLGLLGTLFGFIGVVRMLDAQDIVSRADLMNGAMAALVVTAFGLAVMIPSMLMYGSLRVRLDRIVVELEAAATQIIGYISTRREEKRESAK